jgi:outer membrane protein TolC
MDRADIVRRARLARRDLKAAREAVASAAAGLRGAEYNTKAALDLSGNVGYNGAVDGGGAGDFFASAGRNIPGVSAGVALTLELPFNNTFQEAQRDQQRALYDQAKIQAANLDRLVPIDVKSALDDLRLAAAALELSNAAVAQYEQAIKDEQDRVREGAGTVIDVILTQDRLIRAQQNQVSDRAQYAAALAQLRFVMGAMPSRADEAMTAVNGLLGPRAPTTGGSNAATGQ